MLQAMPNGQPGRPGFAARGASAQQPAAARAPPTGKQPRRAPANAAGGADGSGQPDAKRQRTLGGGTAASQAPAKEAQRQKQRSAQPGRPPPGAAVIDITVSDATAASREPGAERDAAAGEDVSSQRILHGVDSATIAGVSDGQRSADRTASIAEQPDIELETPASVADGAGSHSVSEEVPADGIGRAAPAAENGLASLEVLGFGRSQAQAALTKCGNDLERAANLLCSGMA